MPPLSEPSRLIAPESRRLLREARRAKRMGFDRTADELAAASFRQKMTEPTISRYDDRMAMAKIKEAAAEQEVRSAQDAAAQQLAGRKAFASGIKEAAKEQGGDEAYNWARQEAPKYGVTAAALANFFERNKIKYKRTPETPIAGGYTPERASGTQGATGTQSATGGLAKRK